MATLVLGLAGQAVGQAVLGSTAISIFGASISGAALGGAIGGAIGQYIDNGLLGAGQSVTREGPRLSEQPLLTSQEGAAVPRVFGRGRVAGQVIWASRYLETVTSRSQTVGGKGGGGQTVTQTEYSYSVSIAVGLCEGPVSGVGRIWADGRLLDMSEITFRLHKGTDDQEADSIIEAIEGSGNAPAYRGLAYIVFEDLPLDQFGNRVPQIQVEVFRALSGTDVDALENRGTAVVLTPGMGEFAYELEAVFRDLGGGRSQAENVNNSNGRADVLVSLDQLEDIFPGLQSVSIVVTWFGTDLRCGSCEIKPGVELINKATYPKTWSVNGVARAGAHMVSKDDDERPNFGGTPSDASIVALIAELKSRGLKVTLYPFIMMDVPPGNALPDPYDTQAAEQPAFPWRGRITVNPAPGQTGTPDKTANADTQVTAFLGAAASTDFVVDGTLKTVSFTGTASDWGLRRFILHYAHLASVAGGVDAFLIGSELRGLTTVRGASNSFPAVAALQSLAGDVKTIVGASTMVSYAADWSEYFGYQPADGSGDVFFHLDPLWADNAIDMIAVDVYHPLSDWRDGQQHLDAVAGYERQEDRDYLRGNIEGGEGYDWYYASSADRDGQVRSPITDGAYSKPWVYRYKDLRNWWSNLHYDRPGGVELAGPTAWTPQGKPFWFAELGCPAVDKGGNEPNVFYDNKSSESKLPHYSRGNPNDLIQRRFLEAVLSYWAPESGNNPVSTVYSGPMVASDQISLWSWDARPFPDFPSRFDVWTDAGNWRLGHWLNGRLGLVSLSELVRALSGDNGVAVNSDALQALVPGYVIDRPMSPRAAIEPLASAYHFDAIDTGAEIKFVDTASAPIFSINAEDYVDRGSGTPAVEMIRAQETELPNSVRLSYIDWETDYRIATVESRKLSGAARGIIDQTAPIVLDQQAAQALADQYLQSIWAMRERLQFSLPASYLNVEVGDRVSVPFSGGTVEAKVTRVTDGLEREIEAVSFDGTVFDAPLGPSRSLLPPPTTSFGRPELVFLDIPDLGSAGAETTGYMAVSAAPWPGRSAIYKSASTEGFDLHGTATLPAITGELMFDFYTGPLFRWDRGNEIYVRLYAGGVSSVNSEAVLNGANACAIQSAPGQWEVVQFEKAELIGNDEYKLSNLLRGQLGTEAAMANPTAAGARFVLLDGAVRSAGLSDAERLLELNYKCGPASKPLGDVSFAGFTHAYAGIPGRPLAPVHVRGERSSDGSLALSWIRRSRVSGDDWDQVQVPLGEETEAYEVDVLDGSNVVRTLSSEAPNIVYSIAEQTADFGGQANQPVQIVVYQLSQTFGRGSPGVASLWV